jgi:alpha/beta superfamily hydrolase
VNTQVSRRSLSGPAGTIEALVDLPDPTFAANPRGVAVVAHPHPLFGGTMDNKVVHTLARAFAKSGWTAVRFNFRGVGASQGVYDEGRGEADDMLAIVRQLAAAGQPLALAGFSFGAFVAAAVLCSLWTTRPAQLAVLAGIATSRFEVPSLPLEAIPKTLVIHGEQDDTVPLDSVLDWARPQGLPVTVFPGGGHFFHGQLPILRDLVTRHIRS